MTVLDWIIVAIISIGAILGFTKGFIRQLASIVGLVVGLLVARALFASVGEKLAEDWYITHLCPSRSLYSDMAAGSACLSVACFSFDTSD